MKITDEMIDYIGVLARMKITGEEREASKAELSKIIDYMDVLNELDTDGIEAMSHAFPVKNVFREDVIKPSVDREEIILNAANKKDGCFKVPKAVE
ncbi:MAG: Asp-tRNA(Asn)/Glu-tRNA(Gln) amidotransferase subunit GatC [Epulopiscium sp.]|nr:Asp-tRNA(Asn)/Glu-tRNA(Gln) amidotransferase subunit GatC [Candidatus Epulonipiscium sp.]